MKIMGKDDSAEVKDAENGKEKDNLLGQKEIAKDTTVDKGDPDMKGVVEGRVGKVYPSGDKEKALEISAEEKRRFVDAIVKNERFRVKKTIFGGIELVIRSLTNEEARAVASYCLKKSVADPTGQITGKYRMYLLAAHVEMYNGTSFEPMKAPLFSTVKEDGTEVDPAWVAGDSVKYWDSVHPAVSAAIAECVSEFELKYEYLTKKAEDVNFWKSDTH